MWWKPKQYLLEGLFSADWSSCSFSSHLQQLRKWHLTLILEINNFCSFVLLCFPPMMTVSDCPRSSASIPEKSPILSNFSPRICLEGVYKLRKKFHCTVSAVTLAWLHFRSWKRCFAYVSESYTFSTLFLKKSFDFVCAFTQHTVVLWCQPVTQATADSYLIVRAASFGQSTASVSICSLSDHIEPTREICLFLTCPPIATTFYFRIPRTLINPPVQGSGQHTKIGQKHVIAFILIFTPAGAGEMCMSQKAHTILFPLFSGVKLPCAWGSGNYSTCFLQVKVKQLFLLWTSNTAETLLLLLQ